MTSTASKSGTSGKNGMVKIAETSRFDYYLFGTTVFTHNYWDGSLVEKGNVYDFILENWKKRSFAWYKTIEPFADEVRQDFVID